MSTQTLAAHLALDAGPLRDARYTLAVMRRIEDVRWRKVRDDALLRLSLASSVLLVGALGVLSQPALLEALKLPLLVGALSWSVILFLRRSAVFSAPRATGPG